MAAARLASGEPPATAVVESREPVPLESRDGPDAWISPADYFSRLAAGHPWVPPLAQLARRADGTCGPPQLSPFVSEVGLRSPRAIPLSKLFARSPQVVLGRVLAAEPGVRSDPPQVLTRIVVAVDEALRDDEDRILTGERVEVLLAGGTISREGTSLCTSGTVGVATPAVADRVVLFGASPWDSSRIIHAEETIFRVVEGQIEVPHNSARVSLGASLEELRRVAEEWPPRDLPERIREVGLESDDIFWWMSAKEYYAWLPFAPGLPKPETLPRRAASGCAEGGEVRAKRTFPSGTPPIRQPLVRVVEKARVVLIGRVTALYPGVVVQQETMLRTLVEIEPEVILRDAEHALAKAEKDYILLDGGEFTVDGVDACNAADPALPLPAIGRRVFFAGAADPFRPGLLQGESGFHLIENERVRVSPDRLFVEGDLTLVELQALARSGMKP